MGGVVRPGQCRRTTSKIKGDLWGLYKGLDGGGRVAVTTEQQVPRRGGQAAFSDEGKGEPGTVVTGPVLSELNVVTAVRFGQIRDDRPALRRLA